MTDSDHESETEHRSEEGCAPCAGYAKEARRKGMGGHQSARMDSEIWLTPPEIVAALGPFDLDPCAPSERPWDTARMHYDAAQDGLKLPWQGRVWLNPPYGSQTGAWLKRLASHGDGVAIVFARTETRDWQTHIWSAADAIMFLHGRLHFYRADGTRAKANAGAPSALIAYGQNNVTALRESGISGAVITHWSGSSAPLSHTARLTCGDESERGTNK